MPHTDTKERILDVAERLFADRGFADTSLRMITAEAGANLAAVNYHFQSKDALILAVIARRMGPLNERRLALLDAVEARAGQGPLPLEDILGAFFEPLFRGGAPCVVNPNFGRLLGRMYIEPGDLFSRVFRDQMAPIRNRFLGAAQRALPGLPLEEIFWRMHFLIGALAHTMSGLHHIKATSDGLVDVTDADAILERLIVFLAAGFRAPAPVKKGEGPCVSQLSSR